MVRSNKERAKPSSAYYHNTRSPVLTICISAKVTREDGSVITRTASDSEVSFGNKRLQGLVDTEKVIQFNGASVAASGSGCVFEALLMLKADQKFAEAVQFRTREDIRTFALDFFAQFEELVTASGVSKEDASMGTILITTKDKVFGIFLDLSIFEFKEYFCSGSGADTAQGLMIAGYKRLGANPSEEDLEALLTEVIEETCKLEMGCGGDVRIYEVLAPNPPRVSKKVRKKKLTTKDESAKIAEAMAPEERNDYQSRTRRTGLS